MDVLRVHDDVSVGDVVDAHLVELPALRPLLPEIAVDPDPHPRLEPPSYPLGVSAEQLDVELVVVVRWGAVSTPP
jgi:hypothetical protein